MSYPILYDAVEVDFGHLGLGILKDAISCMVTEERNGVFELDMTYPIAGTLSEKLEVDYLIKADAGHAGFSKGQLFRIERIDKAANGTIQVLAKHVSYLAQSLALEPRVQINNQNANEALESWQRSIVGSHPFTVTSNISERRSTELTIVNHQNARIALGGATGSILDIWGGEYIFDNHRIDLRAERGGRANTLISYGRNLTDLNQEENITNTFTSIYPYAIYRNEDGKEEIITLDNQLVMDSENAKYFAHRRVLPVDFSREFERGERPTVHALRSLAEAYLEEHEIGVPRVSISLRFVDLTKSLNQSGLVYEQVNLCDMVPVRFEKLGIDTVAKITRIVWDVLLEQYEFLEIGESRSTLSDTIRQIEREVSVVNNNTNSALTAANGKNSIFFGPTEPVPPFRVGDLWYRPNGEHTELWMWDGNGWKFVMSTAPSEVILNKIEDLETESENMRLETERALESARRDREDLASEVASTLKVADAAREEADSARQEASEALNHANDVQGIANDAQRIAQEARDLAEVASGDFGQAVSDMQDMVSNASGHADRARRFAEDAQSHATTVTSASGEAFSHAQTAQGHMMSARNSERDASLHVQTAREILSEVEDVHGNVTTLVTTAQGHITSAQNAAGQASAHAVTAQGVLTEVNNRHGDVARLVTTAQGHAMTATNASGDASRHAQTAQGFVQTATTQAGFATTASQTAAGFAQTATTQAGLATVARQDAQGFSQSASDSAGEASTSMQTARSILAQIVNEETGLQSQVTQLSNQFNVTIGGISSRNLLRNSTWNNGREHWHNNWSTTRIRTAPEADKPTSHILTLLQSTSTLDHHSNPLWVEQGVQYTVSADVRFRGVVEASGTTIFRNRIHNNQTDTGAANALWDWGRTAANVGADLSVLNRWRRVTYTFTAPASGWYRIGPSNNNNTANRIHDFREIMITRGTVQTGWQAHDADSNDHTDTQFTVLNGQISQRVTTATHESEILQLSNAINQRVTTAAMNSAITQSATGVTTHVNNTASAIRGEMSLMSDQFNVTIGGISSQNMMRNSTWNNDREHWHNNWSTTRIRTAPEQDKPTSHILTLQRHTANVDHFSNPIRVEQGVEYTVSFDIRLRGTAINAGNTIVLNRIHNNTTDTGSANTLWDWGRSLSNLGVAWNRLNEWDRVSFSFTATHNGWYRLGLSNRENSGARIVDYREIMMTRGNNQTGWQPHSADATDRTSASFTILENQIDHRITDSAGNVLANLNLSPAGVRIEGRLIHLNGQTLIDNAVIQDAHIHGLRADKLTVNSTLDASRVNVIQLNADNITTGTLHASRIRVGNAHNMATLDPEVPSSRIRTGCQIVNRGGRNVIQGSMPEATAHWGDSYIMATTDRTAFQHRQVYRFSFNASRSSNATFTGRRLRCVIRAVYTDGHVNVGSVTMGTDLPTSVNGQHFNVDVPMNTALDPNREFVIYRCLIGWNASHTGSYFIRDISLTPLIGGTLIENDAIETNHMRANSINGDRIQAGTLRADRISAGTINTSHLDINHYRFDGQSIGTVGDNDIVLRRGSGGAVASAQRDRLIIGRHHIRFYMEGDGTIDGTDGDTGTSGDARDAGMALTGTNRAGFIELNANRLSAFNMSQRTAPPTTEAQRQPLRNIHLQPADKWVRGVPGGTGLGTNRGGGEVRCTYTTSFPVSGGGTGQIYAPLRARRLSVQGQTFNTTYTQRVGNVSRHLTVDVDNRRLRVSSDAAGLNTASIHASAIVVGTSAIGSGATASLARTDYRNGWCGTTGNSTFSIRRNGEQRISVNENSTTIRAGERVGNGSNAAVVLANSGNGGGNFSVGQDSSGTARIWSMPIFDRASTSSSNALRVTSSGTIERMTSAERYKININKAFDLDFSKRILDVKPASWFDRNNSETYASILTKHMDNDGQIDWDSVDKIASEEVESLKRIGGLIAEDVEAAGLHMYVSYGDDGKTIEGVQYDRLWTLLIPIVKDQEKRLSEQESEIKNLKKIMEESENGK